MRIPCPICGSRDSREFRILGEAGRQHPQVLLDAEPESQLAAFADHVYFRDNPAGPTHELWFHASGCRAWLDVHRNAATHEVLGARLASEGRS